MLSESEGYWCSVGDHGEMEEVYLEIDLGKVTRVSEIVIKWSYSALQFGIDFKKQED